MEEITGKTVPTCNVDLLDSNGLRTIFRKVDLVVITNIKRDKMFLSFKGILYYVEEKSSLQEVRYRYYAPVSFW